MNINSLVVHPDSLKVLQSLNKVFLLQKTVSKAFSVFRRAIKRFFFFRSGFVSMVDNSKRQEIGENLAKQYTIFEDDNTIGRIQDIPESSAILKPDAKEFAQN